MHLEHFQADVENKINKLAKISKKDTGHLQPNLNYNLSLKLMPNPVTNDVTVQFYLDKGKCAIIYLTSINGAIIIERNITGNGHIQNEYFKFTNLTNGLYYLVFCLEKSIITKTLLIK